MRGSKASYSGLLQAWSRYLSSVSAFIKFSIFLHYYAVFCIWYVKMYMGFLQANSRKRDGSVASMQPISLLPTIEDLALDLVRNIPLDYINHSVSCLAKIFASVKGFILIICLATHHVCSTSNTIAFCFQCLCVGIMQLTPGASKAISKSYSAWWCPWAATSPSTAQSR